jgi:antitoxin (DNA-binding transcriptional repressor) of toxin-antitoxin stability system
MKTYSVGEFKAKFSDILQLIQKGQEVGVSYGKKKHPIAILTPPRKHQTKKKRQLGLLKGKMTVTFAKDFKMTEEELLGYE